jgi:hypothetical protein
MTEADYLASENPDALLDAFGRGLPRRKLILFACGCLRLVPFKATDRKIRHAIELIERHADGIVPAEKIADLTQTFWEGRTPAPFLLSGVGFSSNRLAQATTTAVYQLAAALCDTPEEPADPLETARDVARAVVPDRGPAAQARVFREIAGNLFRPGSFDPAWRTSAVVGLADAIQADRGFDRLPILADALEDAGCDSAELLAHFRGPGTHARGCWALDLVLGKE